MQSHLDASALAEATKSLKIKKVGDNYYFVSVERQTFGGFEMISNLRDTSPLRNLCT